jgi:hypothetical protein
MNAYYQRHVRQWKYDWRITAIQAFISAAQKPERALIAID